MVDKRITEYINKYKQAYGWDQIRDALLSQGYQLEEVEKAIKSARERPYRKKISKRKLAIFVLLIIGVAIFFLLSPLITRTLVGIYSDLFGSKTFTIYDKYCNNGNAIIAVWNSGTGSVSTSVIKITDTDTDRELQSGKDYTWGDSSGSTEITSIGPGKIGRVKINCGAGRTCRYRLASDTDSFQVEVSCM